MEKYDVNGGEIKNENFLAVKGIQTKRKKIGISQII